MPEPTYDVYRPTSRPVPEPPIERTGPPACDARQRPITRRGGGLRLGGGLAPGFVCVAIWAMSGGGYFWPMWVFFGLVMMGGGCAGGRGRRRHW